MYESFERRNHGKVLTLELAKQLTPGTWLHTPTELNSQGKPRRYRVTSVKTWKTRPDYVEVRVRYGVEKRVYTVHPHQLHYWVIGDTD